MFLKFFKNSLENTSVINFSGKGEENLRSSNKKKNDQELILVPRSVKEALTKDINDKIENEIVKSLSDKIKLNNEEKTCRHC